MTERPIETTDWLRLARSYLAHNAAESGADHLIKGMADEIERLQNALLRSCWHLSDRALVDGILACRSMRGDRADA